MKSKWFVWIAIFILVLSSSAAAITPSQHDELHEAAAMFNVFRDSFTFEDTFGEPYFEYLEDDNMFCATLPWETSSAQTLKTGMEMLDGAYDEFMEMCTALYEHIKTNINEISSEVLIAVGITGNDGNMALCTLNGVDVTFLLDE